MHSIKPVLSGRLLLAACAAYTVGITVRALFSPLMIITATILFIFVYCVIFKKLAHFLVAIIAIFSFFGGILHFHIAEKQNADFAGKYAGRYVTVSGNITDISFTQNESQQIIIKTDSISALGKTENKDLSVCLYTDLDESFSIGDKITFSDIFTPFERTSTHSFDSETYFYTKSIIASFSLSSEFLSSSPGNPSFIDKVRLFSGKCSEKIRSLIGNEEGEVAAAITLGDRSGFTDTLTEVFTKSGISHIVAVSGMHLSILVGFLFFLASKSRVNYKIRNLFAILTVFLYMTLTGFSPSVIRAGIMTICALTAAVFDRKEDIPTSFFLSAAIILATNPYTVFDAGFLLSYTSLAGILIFAGPLNSALKFLPGFIRCTLATTLSATIMTFPVLAYIFNSASLVSVITNILVVPLVSIIFITVLITAVMSFVYAPFAAVLAFIPKMLIKFVLICAKTIGAIPLSVVNIKSPGILWITCFIIFVALFYFRLTGRKTGWTGLIAFSFAICTLAISLLVSALTTSVTFFDIGQGDCALITLPGYHHYLVDTGPNGNTTVSALRSAGVNKLDIVFISHADNDHSGGLAHVLENFPVRKVVLPNYDILSDELTELSDIAVTAGANVEFADRFTGYSLSGMTADVLWPSGSFRTDDKNDGSLVLCLDIKGNTFLFTGDISSVSEHQIARFLNADVLKVAHHGSADSSSSEFLKSTSPKYSVISVGRNNTYGHPDEKTLSRLEKSGSKILRTDLLGDITFDIGLSGNMEVNYGSN